MNDATNAGTYDDTNTGTTDATNAAVTELVRDAIDVYRADPAAREELEGYARRLKEPLRVAVAGMVKAGKSTLLNAVIGEEIAPTDAGECTQVVTWYRYAYTPKITLYPVEGEPRTLPLRRVDGRLQLDMGDTPAAEVERLVVDWPSETLKQLTLIDTPGIASLSGDVSARSTGFLTPEDKPSEADAVIYLMRHMHASDLKFLEAFRDTAAGQTGTVNALAVLSRADEVGAGRIDSLLSARDIAARYRRDETLRTLALEVTPIAGLLAQSARTLRQDEFAALSGIARLKRDQRQRLLLSADRFIRPTDGVSASPEIRASLLDRFGLFGIRLASVLITSGYGRPTALAHELARRSGLDELLKLVAGQFQARASHLKARTALIGVETLLQTRPCAGTERLAVALERILASAHEFRELQVLSTLRTAELELAPEMAKEAERLIGGQGTETTTRLGLGNDASAGEQRAQALEHLHRWRILAENPLTGRAAVDVCAVVARSCEAALAQTQDASRAGTTPRLVLSPEPGPGSG
ncbi:P-loop NTPase family protein [Arthrobacter pigmenti]